MAKYLVESGRDEFITIVADKMTIGTGGLSRGSDSIVLWERDDIVAVIPWDRMVINEDNAEENE